MNSCRERDCRPPSLAGVASGRRRPKNRGGNGFRQTRPSLFLFRTGLRHRRKPEEIRVYEYVTSTGGENALPYSYTYSYTLISETSRIP